MFIDLFYFRCRLFVDGGNGNESKMIRDQKERKNQESCAECRQKITEGGMRFEVLSNDGNENENSKLYHVGCFDRVRRRLKWLNSVNSIAGKKRFSKPNSEGKSDGRKVDEVNPNNV